MDSISDLVKVHRRHETSTPLRECFGDGFLYSNNPLYRKIRDQAIHIGTTFSHSKGLAEYEICPHLCFKTLLKKKKIPYFRNLRPILAMQKVNADLPIDKILEIKKNKILHESAHLIAFKAFETQLHVPIVPQAKPQFVLTNLLSESYASATENVGKTFINDSIHKWVYLQSTNSFGCEEMKYQNLLIRISTHFGPRFAYKLSIFSFLWWHFFLPPLDRKSLQKILKLCAPDQRFNLRDKNLFIEYSHYHFRVRDWFRREVAEFYFKSCGLEESIDELLSFDFISHLLDSDTFLSRIEKLIKVMPSHLGKKHCQ